MRWPDVVERLPFGCHEVGISGPKRPLDNDGLAHFLICFIKEKLDMFGVEYFPANREQFRHVLQEEIDRAGKVIREKKMSAQ